MRPGADDGAIGEIACRLHAAGVSDPSGRVLSTGAAGAEIVVGTVADGQPLSRTELGLALAAPRRLLRGLAGLALIHGAREALLAIREDYWEPLTPLRASLSQTRIAAVAVAPRYPLDTASLICDLAEQGTLERPLERVAVFDAATLVDAGTALDGAALPARIVSVVGEISRPQLLQVPLGSTIFDLVEACGGGPDGWRALHNGHAGSAVGPMDAVDLDTRTLLVLGPRHPLIARAATPPADHERRCASACSGCRACTDRCPAHLNGSALQPHRVTRAIGAGWLGSASDAAQGVLPALQCSGCRLCDVSCPAQLEPAAIIGLARARLAQRGLRAASAAPLEPVPGRAGRRLSLERLTAALGLAHCVSPPPSARPLTPSRLTFPLMTRGGWLRQAAVGPRATVDRGALLARGAPGVDLRAPLSGRVLEVDQDAGIVLQVG